MQVEDNGETGQCHSEFQSFINEAGVMETPSGLHPQVMEPLWHLLLIFVLYLMIASSLFK